MPIQKRVSLWEAINRYVVSCGGVPDKHVYGNTRRQRAVADVEKALLHLVSDANPPCPDLEECSSCRGLGYFNVKTGKATNDRAGRKCLDCAGEGRVVATDEQAVADAMPAARAKKELKGRRKLSVFEQHELKIARDTIRMPEAIVGVMGGPSKTDARASILRLTGKLPKEWA
jgi:hypothetical protein